MLNINIYSQGRKPGVGCWWDGWCGEALYSRRGGKAKIEQLMEDDICLYFVKFVNHEKTLVN